MRLIRDDGESEQAEGQIVQNPAADVSAGSFVISRSKSGVSGPTWKSQEDIQSSSFSVINLNLTGQDHMSADERMREFLSRSLLFRCAKEKVSRNWQKKRASRL